MADLRPAIRAERLALIEVLESLPEDRWDVPSLCEGWTVRDVAAHVAWAPTYNPVTITLDLARSGFRVNRAAGDAARRWALRGRGAILDQLHRNVDRDARPTGMPWETALVDAVVHSLDVRRPLGVPRRIPADALVPALDFCARTRWPASTMLGGSVARRISGLRLVADDVDWAYGDGAEVHAPGDVLALVVTGRPVRAEELGGPGAGRLAARLGP